MKSNSVCNIIAELSRPRERVQRSTTSKKIYLSTHPRKFGYDVSVLRPSVRPLEVRDGNQLSARRGRSMLYFVGGKKCDVFVQHLRICAFSLDGKSRGARNGVTIVVSFKKLFNSIRIL